MVKVFNFLETSRLSRKLLSYSISLKNPILVSLDRNFGLRFLFFENFDLTAQKNVRALKLTQNILNDMESIENRKADISIFSYSIRSLFLKKLIIPKNFSYYYLPDIALIVSLM